MLKRTPAVALAALTIALPGCGGSGSSGNAVSPSAYVKAVCGAVGPFERDIQKRSSALDLSSIKSATEGKQALQGFLGAAAGDTSRAVSELRAAGAPDVTNGPRIASAIVSAFANLSSALGTAAQQAAALPTTSNTAFKNAATALGQSVRTSMGNIGSGLSGLRNKQLEAAAQKEKSCTSISG